MNRSTLLSRLAIAAALSNLVATSTLWSQESPTEPSPVAVSTSAGRMTATRGATPVVAEPAQNPLGQEATPDLIEQAPVVESTSNDVSAQQEWIETGPAPVSPSDVSGLPYPETWPRISASRCYLSEASSQNAGCGESSCQRADCVHCNNGLFNSSSTHYGSGLAGRWARFKANRQRSHWGYCNYFDERPLGASVVPALTRQIDRGLQDSMMLYHFDFYPDDSPRAGELTARGRAQLAKLLQRMQITSVPIQIQVTDDNAELDQVRRETVISAMSTMGVPAADALVVLAPVRHEGFGIEASQTYPNMLESVISRGRTIRESESATFGGR